MSEVIAGTYEIIQQLGAGGGGTVYLANHIRLNKRVVLKADKRKITTSPTLLRREVDVLKDLNHPNIPRVYDFFVDGMTVYTAMDYISGESLDQPLKRGEHFSQAQIVRWSKQVLDALAYLHSPTHGVPPRGYVHSDIKPANLMCKPDGDICLIDFNIALAIGEENIVGSSPGYASPEHYGQDYTFSGSASSALRGDETVLLDGTEPTSGQSQTGSRPKRVIIPDARSDIYSLGATLYHMLSGRRPAKYAVDVVPLSESEFDPQLVRIINKAMCANPDLRYQTAREMLAAFQSLHKNSPRVRAFRHTRNGVAAILSLACLMGVGMSFAGLRQMERVQSAAADQARQAQQQEVQAKAALSSLRNAESAYAKGDLSSAKALALNALWDGSPYRAQAQKVLTDALGVYDLFDGLKAHSSLALPSEPLKLVLSPEGEKLAVFYAYEAAVFDCETGQSLAVRPTRPTALSDIRFLGGDILLYAGEQGLEAYDIKEGRLLWQGEPATHIALSGNGACVAAVLGQEKQALVYDAPTGKLLHTVSFQGRRQSIPPDGGVLADPEDALLALNDDGSMLAASFDDGGLFLFDTAGGEAYEIMASSDYTHMEGGFYKNYFAFSAWNTSECVFLIYDTKTLTQTGGFTAQVPFLVKTDSAGICVASGNLLVEIDPATGKQRELAYAPSDIVAYSRSDNGSVLVSTAEGKYALYNSAAQLVAEGNREAGCELPAAAGPFIALASRETPSIPLLKMETHLEAQLCAYPPGLAHTEARLSADGTRIMLFQYDRFTLLDREGGILCQTELPDAMEVYDQQFRRDEAGSRLEVTYRDGRVTAYSAQDGCLLWEKQGQAPKGDLTESFETSRWRFETSPHGAPRVYDRTTGELYRELERDSYLTYVTEVGEYLAVQYLSTQGNRYGLLLDQNCDTVAYLPGLCDVVGDTLVLDDDMGNLRQSRMYSLRELKALAEQKKEEEVK